MFSCSDASIAIWHCDHLLGKRGASFFAFRWFVKRVQSVFVCITKTRLFKYIENYHLEMKLFRYKNSDIFRTPAQNTDLGTR